MTTAKSRKSGQHSASGAHSTWQPIEVAVPGLSTAVSPVAVPEVAFDANLGTVAPESPKES